MPLYSGKAVEGVPIEKMGPFDRLMGFEILSFDENEARGRLKITEHHHQPAGLVHGGVMATMAETLASWATWVAVSKDGKIGVGLSNQAHFIRSARSGSLHGLAKRRHRGRSTWIWDVEISDDDDNICALVRMTIMVRSPITQTPQP